MTGISGSGKTTFSRALAARLGVPVTELDALVHGPNWAETPDDVLRAQVDELTRREGWVIDGTYERKLGDLLFERADTLVWLDLPRRVCLARLWRRTSRRIRTGEEIFGGNVERWRTALWGRESLFMWAIRRHFELRRTIPERAARHAQLEVVRLCSPAEVERFLGGITSGA